MSYWFRMNFKEIEEKNLLDFCIMVSEECKKAATEILINNKFYIPSIANDFDEINNHEYRRKWREIDRYWLYSLFAIRYVYWRDKKLLGIIGEIPEKIKDTLTSIEFQNSTDQDYDYEEWYGINYFEEIVRKLKDADAADVAFYLSKERDSYNKDEVAEDLEYYRKTAIYEIIYNSLELDRWLWNKEGNFKQFSMQAINGIGDCSVLSQILENVRQEKLEEFCEEKKDKIN